MIEFINQEDYKYIRALGALYYRLTEPSHKEIYKVLEPILADFRRLAIKKSDGKIEIIHMDEFID